MIDNHYKFLEYDRFVISTSLSELINYLQNGTFTTDLMYQIK